MSEKPDIVERLRRDQYKECDCWRCVVCEDAAAEIERLRAENQTQADTLQGKDDALSDLRSRLALAERVVEAAEAIDADFLHDDDPKAPEGGAFWVGQQRSIALRTALTAYRKETT